MFFYLIFKLINFLLFLEFFEIAKHKNKLLNYTQHTHKVTHGLFSSLSKIHCNLFVHPHLNRRPELAPPKMYHLYSGTHHHRLGLI